MKRLFENAPNHHTLEHIRDIAVEPDTMREISPSRWVPARPMGFDSWGTRFKLAWMVFTGKADALTWPGQPFLKDKDKSK